MVHKSQLEQKFGGTAPNVTCFWPPVVPKMPEPVGLEGVVEAIPRENYNELWLNNQGLTPMPQYMRSDLEPQPIDQLSEEFNPDEERSLVEPQVGEYFESEESVESRDSLLKLQEIESPDEFAAPIFQNIEKVD